MQKNGLVCEKHSAISQSQIKCIDGTAGNNHVCLYQELSGAQENSSSESIAFDTGYLSDLFPLRQILGVRKR